MPNATIPAAIKEIVLGSGTATAKPFVDCANTGAAATTISMESRLRFICYDLYVEVVEYV